MVKATRDCKTYTFYRDAGCRLAMLLGLQNNSLLAQGLCHALLHLFKATQTL